MESRDWIGNKNSIFKTLGASNHTNKEREENDFYATEPKAAELLLENEELHNIWECACGQGHLAKVFADKGKLGLATDLIDRGYGSCMDFLTQKFEWDGDIVTNPPYKYAKEFVEQALRLISPGHKVCMFLKIQFLEGKARKKLFQTHPPKVIYISSSRLNCAMNGDFVMYKFNSAVAYAWFVWQKGYIGETIIKWIN